MFLNRLRDFLFAILFLFGSYYLWNPFLQSASWTTVPAKILTADLRLWPFDLPPSRGSTKGPPLLVLTTTYSYSFDQHVHIGQRVFLDDYLPTFRASHLRQRLASLTRHRQSGAPMDVLVDPQDPRESLVFRELSWAFFLLPLVGVWLLIGAFGYSPLTRCLARPLGAEFLLDADGPSQSPWITRTDWVSFQAVSLKEKANGSTWWALAVSLLLFLAALFVFPPTVGEFETCIVPLFLLGFAAALFWHFRTQTARFRALGAPRIRLSRVPIETGTECRLLLEIASGALAERGGNARLQCRQKIDQVDRESTGEKTLFAAELDFFPGKAIHEGANPAFPLSFAIPGNLPGRSCRPDKPQISWSLLITPRDSWPEDQLEFELPVYDLPHLPQN